MISFWSSRYRLFTRSYTRTFFFLSIVDIFMLTSIFMHIYIIWGKTRPSSSIKDILFLQWISFIFISVFWPFDKRTKRKKQSFYLLRKYSPYLEEVLHRVSKRQWLIWHATKHLDTLTGERQVHIDPFIATCKLKPCFSNGLSDGKIGRGPKR